MKRTKGYDHPGQPRLRPDAAIDVNTWIPLEHIPAHVRKGKRGAYVRMCVEAVHKVMKEKQKEAGA